MADAIYPRDIPEPTMVISRPADVSPAVVFEESDVVSGPIVPRERPRIGPSSWRFLAIVFLLFVIVVVPIIIFMSTAANPAPAPMTS